MLHSPKKLAKERLDNLDLIVLARKTLSKMPHPKIPQIHNPGQFVNIALNAIKYNKKRTLAHFFKNISGQYSYISPNAETARNALRQYKQNVRPR